MGQEQECRQHHARIKTSDHTGKGRPSCRSSLPSDGKKQELQVIDERVDLV